MLLLPIFTSVLVFAASSPPSAIAGLSPSSALAPDCEAEKTRVKAQVVPVYDREAKNTCDGVKAWVRAEDLSPSTISNGELRIKVSQSCTTAVESVALRLQLNEFSSVKYLKKDAILPTPPSCTNDSAPPDFLMGGFYGNSSNTEMDRYHEALRDPALWEFRAEERTAWKSVITLVRGPFDYAQPLVVPFVAASPHVNYPPGLAHSFSSSRFNEDKPVTDGVHAYRYIALVTFADGHTVEVPAGYTTFRPTHSTIALTPFSTNVTFKGPNCQAGNLNGICSSEIASFDTNSSVYRAQVVLEGGNVVRAGQTLKGKIILNYPTKDSTTVEFMTAEIQQDRIPHWAQAQSVSGGGGNAFAQDGCYGTSKHHKQITLSTCHYRRMLGDEDCVYDRGVMHHSRGRESLKDNGPIEFEIKISEDAMLSFRTHYADFESFVSVHLEVAYPPEIQRCFREMDGFEQASADPSDADDGEDSLWDSTTRIGEKMVSWPESYALKARIPITVLSDGAFVTESPPIHYLAPDAPSPVLLASAPSSIDEVVFPIWQADISVEPIGDTIERMLSNKNVFRRRQDRMGPTRDYFAEPYAGMLWEKKMLVEDGRYPASEGLKIQEAESGYMPRPQTPLVYEGL